MTACCDSVLQQRGRATAMGGQAASLHFGKTPVATTGSGSSAGSAHDTDLALASRQGSQTTTMAGGLAPPRQCRTTQDGACVADRADDRALLWARQHLRSQVRFPSATYQHPTAALPVAVAQTVAAAD